MALTNGKIIRVKETDATGVEMEDLPALSAIADVGSSNLPGDGVIGGLVFSATPTQAECEALRDECQKLRDLCADLRTQLNSALAALRVTSGVGIVSD